jgi:hypothetical protein
MERIVEADLLPARLGLAGLALAILPCTAIAQTPSPGSIERARVDSIVLERTACYGTCPAYRLRLDAVGRVHFQSRNTGDDAPPVTDSIGAGALSLLGEEASRIEFFRLPSAIEGTELCRDRATDHATVTVTFHTEAGAHAVRDYHGCFDRRDHSVTSRVAALRNFERRIDEVAGSARWVRPNRRR